MESGYRSTTVKKSFILNIPAIISDINKTPRNTKITRRKTAALSLPQLSNRKLLTIRNPLRTSKTMPICQTEKPFTRVNSPIANEAYLPYIYAQYGISVLKETNSLKSLCTFNERREACINLLKDETNENSLPEIIRRNTTTCCV
ncbi:unnamed protein product [Blepharisma stoltei]|uniref:Uncharacterized protein n=1 Tax=Blepharisma stoltei TaxID=1481888 RepID=A0AAU9JCH7_9CILI|nr:unnamed protein product [Blepharisma stoltei]